jgi:hypothetical protein
MAVLDQTVPRPQVGLISVRLFVSIQRNTVQQIAEIRLKIEAAAALLAAEPQRFFWLTDLLTKHGLSADEGILVRLHQTPEQAGDLFVAVWLTQTEQFWSFSILMSRQSGEPLEVEQAENITNQVLIGWHQLGIGKSFGAVALEVLHAELQ